jgi:uncharacterized protein with NRDE domain
MFNLNFTKNLTYALTICYVPRMCLVVMAYKSWDHFPIVIAANRDEFFDRPASRAEFWSECPDLLAGRDLTSMGTWLGVTKQGRIGFVTNRRDFRETKLKSPISRGKLVENYLKTNLSPENFSKKIESELQKYEGFNLYVGDLESAYCVSNRKNGTVSIEKGFHTLSNAYWDTRWPKTERVLSLFTDILETQKNKKSSDLPIESLFKMLNDGEQAPDQFLPDTGIGAEKEKLLSSIRISLPGYGTRVSTVLAISDLGEIFFYEKTFETPFSKDGEVASYVFKLQGK